MLVAIVCPLVSSGCLNTGAQTGTAGKRTLAPVADLSPYAYQGQPPRGQTVSQQQPAPVVVPVRSDEPAAVPALPQPLQPPCARPIALDSLPALIHASPPGRDGNEPPLCAVLRAYVEKRPDDAAELLKQYDPASQELLLCFLPIAVKVCEQKRADPAELAQFVKRLQVQLDTSAPKELRVANACFCKRVRGFSDYEPFEPGRAFRACETVEVYFEVQNFTTLQAETQAERPYNIQLGRTLEIKDTQGRTCWGPKHFEPTNDPSRTPRQDVYQRFILPVPPLPDGDYKLEIHVTDLPSKRNACGSLTLSLKSGGS